MSPAQCSDELAGRAGLKTTGGKVCGLLRQQGFELGVDGLIEIAIKGLHQHLADELVDRQPCSDRAGTHAFQQFVGELDRHSRHHCTVARRTQQQNSRACGYRAAMPWREHWQHLVDAADPGAALRVHLTPALATSADNAERLAFVCARVRSITLDPWPALLVDLGSCTLRLTEPSPAATLPPSMARLFTVHGRLQVVGANIDVMWEADVAWEGWLDDTAWPEHPLTSVMRLHGDLYALHPVHHRDGWPVLCFLDHEDAQLQEVDDDLATIALRAVCKHIARLECSSTTG